MSEMNQEFVVPMEATERSSLIVGELKSENAVFPFMLAQFSKIDPSSRKAKIYLYPTLDQAKQLFAMHPPFNFHGEYDSTADVREVCFLTVLSFRLPAIITLAHSASHQTWALPPSTKSSMPVTKLESSEARNNATFATSSGSPMRPIGMVD
jgi:hypothetical protein